MDVSPTTTPTIVAVEPTDVTWVIRAGLDYVGIVVKPDCVVNCL